MSAQADPGNKLDYREYRKQRNLRLLEEIAQFEKSQILQEDEGSKEMN